MRTLVLATRNQGKVKEMRQMLLRFNIDVVGLDQFPDCPEVIEDGETFEANAVKKAETVSRFLNLPALADDSGLEVDALGGEPGVYSARFAGPSATDDENNNKLLTMLRDVPKGQRQGRFQCVLALAVPSESTWKTQGTCEGEISFERQGTGGFGYDPLFFLPEYGKTMGELSSEEKNKISHRGKAMQKFLREVDRLLK